MIEGLSVSVVFIETNSLRQQSVTAEYNQIQFQSAHGIFHLFD